MEEKTENGVRAVCVYCASSSSVAPVYLSAASELGALLADRGVRIINGAGNRGLMNALSEAALAAGGEVTGVIPRFMTCRDWYRKDLTQLIVTETIHERKQRMAALSDAAIALPGGCGTLEELLEIITWRQLGLYAHPVVILNTAGYYDPLLEMLRRALAEGFMPEENRSLWRVARTPAEAFELCFPGRG